MIHCPSKPARPVCDSSVVLSRAPPALNLRSGARVRRSPEPSSDSLVARVCPTHPGAQAACGSEAKEEPLSAAINAEVAAVLDLVVSAIEVEAEEGLTPSG